MTVTSSRGGPSSRPKSKGKGKQVKHFLDSQVIPVRLCSLDKKQTAIRLQSAVNLAAQIVDQQEAKTNVKADRKHHTAQVCLDVDVVAGAKDI